MADKRMIAQQITSIYKQLPRFHVGVILEELAKDPLFVGGEPANDFIRIWVDHIARTFNDEAMKVRFLNVCSELLIPLISERGLRWEMHVDETPFSLWSINGLKPPPPNSAAEIRWQSENRATPYSAEEA